MFTILDTLFKNRFRQLSIYGNIGAKNFLAINPLADATHSLGKVFLTRHYQKEQFGGSH